MQANCCMEFFNAYVIPEINAQTLRAKKITNISINLLVVYRKSVNLIGYITRRLSADSLQL